MYRCFISGRGYLTVLLALIAFQVLPAMAAPVDCVPMQQDLVKIPEIAASGGRLRGTILLNDQQERLNFRTPPQSLPGDLTQRTADTCFPQYVRAYHAGSAVPAQAGLSDPLPGPTLRARVGDIVELTFLNQIDPNHFGNSIDRDLAKGGTGCDEVTGIYPGKDKFPDCFHGSSTGNLHFHGTHTNPNTTGDNVLIEVRPSNPAQAGAGNVTAATVKPAFDAFFAQCEAILKKDVLSEWPKVWADLPASFTAQQQTLLTAYDTQNSQQLWQANAAAIASGNWPQYYLGAYPYCFQLPHYTAATWPAPIVPGKPALQMGQSPGTHWYHAHKHGSTAIDVSNGMSGAFIIEGEYDDALNKFYRAVPNWTRTQPLLLVNQIGGTPNLEHPQNGRTDKGPDFSVNGRLQPKVRMYPGEVQMWRIVNSSPRSAMYVPYLPEGFTWRQLAQDGVQLAADNYENSQNRPLRIASGNRVDLLVRAPDKPHAPLSPVIVQPNVAGAEIDLVPDAQAIGYPSTLPPPVPLLWVEVSGKGPAMAFIPKEQLAPMPAYLVDIADREVAGHTRTVTFDTGGPGSGKQQTINGLQFSETDQSSWIQVDKLNTVEEWTIVNTTTFQPIDHPFHIHINPFQVTEVFNPNQVVATANGPGYRYVFDSKTTLDPAQCYLDPTKPETWKPCGPVKQPANRVWWDVFPIPSGRSVTVGGTKYTIGGHFKMRSRFVDFAGAFVLHCHILAHEDRGMMTIVAVGVPPGGLSNMHHH